MKRLTRILIPTLAALLVGVGLAAAQSAFPTLPPVAAPTTAPVGGLATLPPPEQTEAATATAPLGVQQTEALPILIADRSDLELLADAALGKGSRPQGWSGSIDVTDPQLPLLIRLDLELLAGAVMGADKRPEGWFGVVPSVPLAFARDIRHDLELLADVVVGAPTVRPAGWTGDDPMMRCSRATQALFTMLQARGTTLHVDFTQPNYCEVAEMTASRYVERQILQPPPANAGEVTNQARYPYQADTAYVVAFLDRGASRKAGVLPLGTGFTPLARSTSNFSRMMLVQGDNFQVFLDYTTTAVTRDQFLALPDVGANAATTCTADWCG